MATQTTIQTRIQSKRDTLANWLAVESTFKPLAGEIIVYEIPSGDATITNPPATLIKVGDGTNYLKDLKYLAARAADVASFLKTDSTGATWTQATFENWIKSLVTIDDVDTSAFAKDADLQQVIADLSAEIDRAKAAEAQALTDAKAYADTLNTAMDTRMDTVEAAAHTHDNIAELNKIVSGDKAKWDAMEQNAKDYADGLNTAMDTRVDALEAKVTTWDAAEQNAKDYADGLVNDASARMDDLEDRVETNETAITTLNANSSTEGSVDYKIAQAVAQLMENPDETMNSINELVTWVNEHAEDAVALSNQVTQNKNDIATEKARAEGVEAGLATRLSDVEAALADDGAIADDIAEALSEAKSYTDTQVQALANGSVAQNTSDIAALKTLVGSTSVDAQIEAAVSELKSGTLTTMQSEIDAVEDRATALESKAHEHANKDVLDGIAASDVTGWNAKVDTISADTGLTASRAGNAVTVGIDTSVVFILNGGTSTTVL